MKRILIITFNCPPRGGSGAVRVAGLVRRLEEIGWRPAILTPELSINPDVECRVVESDYVGTVGTVLKEKAPDFLSTMYADDSSQSNTSSENSTTSAKNPVKEYVKEIFRLPYEALSYPDGYKYWIPDGIEKGSDFLKEEDIDLILSTSPPVSAHIVGDRLAQEFTIPWIADYRDLWTQSHYYTHNPIRKHFESQLEQETLANAEAVTTTTDPFAQQLHQMHGIPSYSIKNGFSLDDSLKHDLNCNQFSVTHTGSLYGEKRDPTWLFQSFSDLSKEYDNFLDDLVFNHYGPVSKNLEAIASQHGLTENVRQHGVVSRKAVQKAQQASQILVSMQWDHPREEEVCPGKIFEYLSVGRPILSFGGPRGVSSRILAETGAGKHAINQSSVYQYIKSSYLEYRELGNVKHDINESAVNRYSHERMRQEFASAFNDTIRT
ncbi:glycosyltransferase [Halomarina litorea]|uniref:glycosyltransferase n=1 Tax=Halomarina litorea TaxID=2961595 RepID=UPI0020C4A3A2|nr:glycosyltransferase [Halomarina sp. BCD28]